MIPMVVPEVPDPPEPSTFHQLADQADRSWRGMASYAAVLARAPITRPGAYRLFIQYNRALAALVRREHLDVIYAHEVWPAGASAVLQSRISGVKSVVVAYGETYGTTSQHARWIRTGKYVCRAADAVVSTSEHCLRGAMNLGAASERSSVIYAGVNFNEFKPGLDGSRWRERHGISVESVVISVLGIVLRRKLDDFLEAVSLIDSSKEIVCVIGGRGPDEDYVRTRLSEMNGPRMIMPGFIPDDELPEFYSATDLLVVSPNSQLECMGQSMKEAMACGRTVVGAAIGGIPEAIDHGRNGLLYDPDEVGSLARVLSEVADDRDQRDRIGSAAVQDVVSTFDARVSAARTLDVFRSVVGATSPD
jgi:glycosyltransferase involved in cell wall biosynthesis